MINTPHISSDPHAHSIHIIHMPFSEEYRSVHLLTSMITNSWALWWLHSKRIPTTLLSTLQILQKKQKVMLRWRLPARNRDSLSVSIFHSRHVKTFPSYLICLLTCFISPADHTGRAQSVLITLCLSSFQRPLLQLWKTRRTRRRDEYQIHDYTHWQRILDPVRWSYRGKDQSKLEKYDFLNQP